MSKLRRGIYGGHHVDHGSALSLYEQAHKKNYEKLESFLRKKGDQAISKTIAKHTSVCRNSDGLIFVTLHETDVLKVSREGEYELNSGGWGTPTTADRINAFLPALYDPLARENDYAGVVLVHYGMFQHLYEWYFVTGPWVMGEEENTRPVVRFRDGMKINTEGIVVDHGGEVKPTYGINKYRRRK